jgi:hypothetical protein
MMEMLLPAVAPCGPAPARHVGSEV